VEDIPETAESSYIGTERGERWEELEIVERDEKDLRREE
jgi:hypothetical protein